MRFKTPTLVGFGLLALGVAAFALRVPMLSSVLGGVALAAGTVLVIVGTRKKPVF